MPRKGPVSQREVIPDPVYRDVGVSRFIKHLMQQGKKSVAENILYRSLDIIKGKSGKDPMPVFKRALDNVKPLLEVKSRRVGGSNYQVPVEVRPERRSSLAMRWIIESSLDRSGKTMFEKLAYEIIDASNNIGGAIKKKEDVHRMAEANKAFAHYRW
ncbi:MAG: 30S ribosomal protein S7 [Deltaproteobacteria bacterium RIFCSPHIGHO2_12_FULL_43_9]|nr:MAG: 30S ribosomal protein S7 [Deltaproteobacteria bacterium RIFCSPHIGHO2_12_FULL_43_9]